MSCNQCNENEVAKKKIGAAFIGTILYSAVMIIVLAIIGYEVFNVFRVKSYLKKAEAGNAEAMYQVGEYYAQGKGVARKMDEAHFWFKKAADAGFVPPAENNRKYQAKAEKNHIDMMFIYGLFVRYGWGVEKDEAAAAEWFKKSADKDNGNPIAQLEYAKCCMSGIGREVDMQLAETYFKKSADQGNEEAEKIYNSLKDNSEKKSFDTEANEQN